jgi:hypothetical protein
MHGPPKTALEVLQMTVAMLTVRLWFYKAGYVLLPSARVGTADASASFSLCGDASYQQSGLLHFASHGIKFLEQLT